MSDVRVQMLGLGGPGVLSEEQVRELVEAMGGTFHRHRRTPIMVEMLMHYYACCDDHPAVAANRGPAWREQADRMVLEELLRVVTLEIKEREPNLTGRYAIAPRGRCLAEAMLQLPLPEWRMPCRDD